MRRIVGLIGTGLFVATFLFMVPAALALQYEDLTYTSNGSSITITDFSPFAINVVVPATIDDLPVTSIGNYAFRDCTSLASIAVDGANPSFSSLDGVLFNKDQSMLIRYPAGKTAKSYTIPDSVTSIGGSAFQVCTSLAIISLPNSVTSISSHAFCDCTSLTSISIPDIVVTIGTDAFYGCTSLASVEIGNSVATIGSGTFYGCTSLASIEIGDSVTNIGSYAFNGCTSLASISIPDGVTSIDFGAFSGCTSLASIVVDAANPSFSSLDGVLFNKDQSMLIQYPAGRTAESYTIPDSVISIGSNAFSGCTSLASIDVEGTNPSYSSLGGVLFNKDQSRLIQYPAGRTAESYTIPDSVTAISDSAFHECTSLTSIEIPDGVTSIGDSAFYGCTSLTSVYFSGNAPRLNLHVFSGTDNTTVYYLPGTSGWGITFGGRPTLLWNPVIDVGEGFGAGENGFGFGISGTANIPIVIEACTNLAEGVWIPLQTNTLSSGTLQFNDPEWMNHPSRIYRISGP